MIFIGVGTNLGERWHAISTAWLLLEEQSVHVVNSSPVYETQPWGDTEQPLYLNAVWEVNTALPPEELLSVLQNVETILGRPQSLRHRWGPRIIDLDLLAYGETTLSTAQLTLPHPWIPYRTFVLGPWKDIAPYFYLPKWNATVLQLWQSCCGSGWGHLVSPPANIPLPPIQLPLTPPAGMSC
ncbi:MAG: 2-amino-4-hydroxy-6-hydroxymethyldihydropteridine diphosphokinase [Bacteroidia bacterium]|nr:2-amino-4-hydroxy-6-hydroxymethyldihydropteridine diphosphokinase [Bacteroidia bacterium]MCX7651369.1 2-amino-4-hydroxy-6-hydroxymethyldihydropteridine diphosphokinase [Bacteroidia bacterium]MDW8416731.1 2-amino-4-hydroxy-6-hydroxymethyldihydropteridine diphosphokinase [Bacteroidia bacterium]